MIDYDSELQMYTREAALDAGVLLLWRALASRRGEVATRHIESSSADWPADRTVETAGPAGPVRYRCAYCGTTVRCRNEALIADGYASCYPCADKLAGLGK
jgi:hypothetical protein